MPEKLLRHYLPELPALLIKRTKPAVVSLNITDRCTQSCIYCEIGSGNHVAVQQPLKIEEICWIIDQMAEMGIKRLAIHGGEPFLFKELPDTIAYASRKGIRCYITSNGMLIHQLDPGLLQLLKQYRSILHLSVDSFKPDIQDFTRGKKEGLSAVLKSVAVLQQYQIPVTLLTVISRHNSQDLLNTVKNACQAGISQVLFQPVIYFSNYPDSQAIDNKKELNVPSTQVPELETMLDDILAFEKKNPVKTNVYRIRKWLPVYLRHLSGDKEGYFFSSLVSRFYCRETDAIINIHFDGTIQACGLLGSNINIKDNQDKSLYTLWSEATASLRKDLNNRNFPSCCNACCHHFSRNLIASLIRYPVHNHQTLLSLLPLFASRAWYTLRKTVHL